MKWDGYRILARREQGVTRLWYRSGLDWADAFPWIVEAIESLPVERVIIDGEAVCLLPDGRPDFRALRSKSGCQQARFIAFDLLDLNGEDLRPLPLSERRTRLQKLLSGKDDALWFSSNLHGATGEALFRHACVINLEGIVSKRIDAAYRSELYSNWRKIKNPAHRRTATA